MSRLSFRKANAELGDELKAAGIYNETVRNLVEQLDILGPRAKAKDSRFTFQTYEGEQRPVEEIARRLQRQELSVKQNENGEFLIDVGDFINDARSDSLKRGKTEVNIKDMARPNKKTSAWTPQTMEGLNPNDLMHVGRFTPEKLGGTDFENPNVKRAIAIGEAEATGDNKRIYEANTMYDFSYEDAEKLGDTILIGNQTLNNFLSLKGVSGERLDSLLDPSSGIRYKDMSKQEQTAFRRKRGVESTQRWMNMGGRSVGDGGTEVVVPGFHAQMEHQKPFTGSIDVLGVDNSTYFSDDKYNRAGYLERYENAEKNDIDTVDYHRMRRANMLSKQMGEGSIDLSKEAGQQGIENAIAQKWSGINYSNARLKKDRDAEINVDNLVKGLTFMREVQSMYS